MKVVVVAAAVTALVGIRLNAFTPGGPIPRPQGNPAAAKIQNPVAPTLGSIAAGKSLYQRFCANCHGSDAKGGPGNDLVPSAPDLTGQEWKHGSSDGEIFSSIKNGVPPDFNMAAWGLQGLKDEEIWSVINYIRTLAKK